MAQLQTALLPPAPQILSPLFLSDRLISLAEQAGKLGCQSTADRLIHLASSVLDETSPPPRRI